MTTSTNLGITLVETGQVDKEAAINTAIDTLDNCIAGLVSHNFSSDADYTLSSSEAANLHILITDTSTYLTTQRNIILPANRQVHIVTNNTLQSIQFKTASGSGVIVGTTGVEWIYCDGTNIIAISSVSSIGIPYDIMQFYPGELGTGAILSAITFPRLIEYAANMPGSYAKCITAPTASTVLALKKNGVSLGTITFSAASTTGSISSSSALFYAGDILTIEAPVTPDATLADVYVTLVGYKYLG